MDNIDPFPFGVDRIEHVYSQLKKSDAYSRNAISGINDELRDKGRTIEDLKTQLAGQRPVKRIRNWSPVTLVIGAVLLIATAVSFVSAQHALDAAKVAQGMAANAQEMAAKIAEAQKKTDQALTQVRSEMITEQPLREINARIDGISLVAEDAGTSPDFICGQEQKTEPTNLIVMYGSRDGTSCNVPNRNYYKRLTLRIPSVK
jgi:enamine deaminase RidA (YjgF/YER057c/UK114 family)